MVVGRGDLLQRTRVGDGDGEGAVGGRRSEVGGGLLLGGGRKAVAANRRSVTSATRSTPRGACAPNLLDDVGGAKATACTTHRPVNARPGSYQAVRIGRPPARPRSLSGTLERPVLLTGWS